MSQSSRGNNRIALAVLMLVLVVVIAWIARRTYWDSEPIKMPLKGEAASNPFYGAEHLAELLGARTERHHFLLTAPARDSVLVITAWHWDLSAARRSQLERWVESGGRLVVDRTLIGTQEKFEHWSGIERAFVQEETTDDTEEDQAGRQARLERQRNASRCHRLDPGAYSICDLDGLSWLRSSRKVSWSLRDELGAQVIRVAVGRGSVTVVNANPFLYREILEGDHAKLFVAVTQLRRADEVHFLSEDHHPGLLILLWRQGAPAISLALALVALALWRRSVRFGPPTASPETARRSLGEQILGTGRFVLRFGNGSALHAATVRALEEAARRRIPGYETLGHDERARGIAALAGLDPDALHSAIAFAGKRRSPEFRNAIALLEAARRKISIRKQRSWHASGSKHDYAGS